MSVCRSTTENNNNDCAKIFQRISKSTENRFNSIKSAIIRQFNNKNCC